MLFGISCLVLSMVMDIILVRFYGYPLLTLIIAKARKSKHFKWLGLNVFGNIDWYYDRVYKNLKGK